MNGNDLSKQFDALRRRFVDLVADLHARKLAIPAGALLAAVVAALVLLPKSPTPPAAPPSTANVPATEKKVEQVAQISMIKPVKLGEDIPLSSSEDPFKSNGGYDCQTVESSPKTVECQVSGITIQINCQLNKAVEQCTSPTGSSAATGGGSSGETGSGTGGSGDGGSTGSTGTPTEPTIRYFIEVATIKLDNTTYKSVEAGSELPRGSSPLAAFIGGSVAQKSGTFLAADGITVTGVDIDPVFQAFALDVGQTATLTDSDGKHHKLTLKKVSRKEVKSIG